MRVLAVVGRVLIALIFVLAGLNKISGFNGTVAYMTQHSMPMAEILAVATIVLELGAGLCVALGYWTRAAALLLALFLVPATLIFHTNLVVAHQQDQTIMLLKNLAIIGGLLTLAAQPPGPAALRRR
jgi:putative oxidoreductase